MIEIEFVNHASYIVKVGNIQLIHDPWLEGRAFQNGWGLLSSTAFDYERFKDITHIWFSHEHPDHFSPLCISKIPAEYRQNITVLFQRTIDHRVLEFCEKKGFKDIIELEPGQRVRIGPEIEITCYPYLGFEDSWLYLETPDCRLLNLNDCGVNNRDSAESIKKLIGPVDVLLTQFSISSWDGNADELDHRIAGARKVLERTVMQTNVFAPKYLIPFASYIWLCHEENYYMNEAFLDLEEVYETLSDRTTAEVTIMYPGDRWQYGEAHSSGFAVERYQKDIKSISSRPREAAVSVAAEELVEASQNFCRQLREASDLSKMRIHLAKDCYLRRRGKPGGNALQDLFDAIRLRIDPARIYIPDHNQGYTFDLMEGLRSTNLAEKDCEVVIGSEALHYSFKFLWGGQTLYINGRFREVYPGGRHNMFQYFHIAGNQVAGKTTQWKTLPGSIFRRLKIMS